MACLALLTHIRTVTFVVFVDLGSIVNANYVLVLDVALIVGIRFLVFLIVTIRVILVLV